MKKKNEKGTICDHWSQNQLQKICTELSRYSSVIPQYFSKSKSQIVLKSQLVSRSFI
jgi:hypothetical protein